MGWKPPSLPWGEGGLWCLSSDFLRDPLLASCDCENYQSETENGSDENNKLCFNLRTFGGGGKDAGSFSLRAQNPPAPWERCLPFSHNMAHFRPQHEATIPESRFSPLFSFFLWGENEHADYLSETEFLPVSLWFLRKQGAVFVLFIQSFARCWVCCLEL